MSTVQKVNFEPLGDLFQTQLRDFGLGDHTLADPLSANPLVDGEWMVLDSNYNLVGGNAAGRTGTTAQPVTVTSYVVWAERGRWDRQAHSRKGTTVIFMGDYEADTRIYNATSTTGGAAITSVNQPLGVAYTQVPAGSGVWKLCLVGSDGTTSAIVGRVTRLPQHNGGRLRFVRASAV